MFYHPRRQFTKQHPTSGSAQICSAVRVGTGNLNSFWYLFLVFPLYSFFFVLLNSKHFLILVMTKYWRSPSVQRRHTFDSIRINSNFILLHAARTYIGNSVCMRKWGYKMRILHTNSLHKPHRKFDLSMYCRIRDVIIQARDVNIIIMVSKKRSWYSRN